VTLAVPKTAGLALGGALLTGGILAVAFNMRGSITGLLPLFPELSKVAGMPVATEAALAAVPVLGFGVFSGAAPMVARKLGEERALGLALVLLVIGLGLRSAAPGVLLFPGTITASCAIAFFNVLLPSLIKRRRPERAGLFIGLYLMALTGGAVVGAVIAVPVFNAAGGSAAAVRLTLGMWALPAAVAALIWAPQLRFRTSPEPAGGCWPGAPPARCWPGAPPARCWPGAPPARRGVIAMGRHALAWQVTLFMGLQSLLYYATISWFPTMFTEHGLGAATAGNLLALMNLGNAVTGLVMPVLAQRMRDQRLLVTAAVLLIMIGIAGSAFAPNAVVAIFVCLLGLGQGAALGLAVFMFTARTTDGHAAAALSGFAQGVGYLIASAGPLLLGFLHAATGGWTVPAVALLGVAVGQFATGVRAGRALTIGVGKHAGEPVSQPGQ
jgi:CP family cyanate transporter-like MFS transporter